MTMQEQIADSIAELWDSRAALQFALSEAHLLRHFGRVKPLQEQIKWIDDSIAKLELQAAEHDVCRAEYLEDR